ncbi:hypothetical protein CTAYLR_007393 [Chrysophaeum taylorii]|uniref:J domain-containing protein n=1 Tax=Chrysophaeum taylorii TaxID=2483200 RepID=A0AAD7XHA6_9STRA|nr:hypothetical protein CTAYLR_007393 [Chrysophaeum taylorii]
MEFDKAVEMSERAALGRKTYALLGVSPGCGEAALRKAYREASLKFHPDKQGGKDEAGAAAAAAMFLKVKEAYELLSDETKRSALDAAVAASERATRAHAERLEKMDTTRRRMREELERREKEAAPPPTPSGPPEVARRPARSVESTRDRVDRLRRSLKVRWRSGRPTSDDDIARLVRRFGFVETIQRSDSGRSATIVFEDEDAATAAAIDEALAVRFKDVSLCTADAWDRLRAAVARRLATASDTSAPRRRDPNADHRRAKEDGDDSLRREECQPPRRDDEQAARRSAKRQRLAAKIQRINDLAQKDDDPDYRAFAQAEYDILTRLLAAAAAQS